jgi:hypothetical protein
VRPASCGDQSITCFISAATPYVDTASFQVKANALVQCTAPIPRISLQEVLLRSGVPVSGDSDIEPNSQVAITIVADTCQWATYLNTAEAVITPPAGWTIIGQNPIHDTSPSVQVPPFGCTPGGGGGGGGGGCAIHAPSLAGHPARRHPDLIACS